MQGGRLMPSSAAIHADPLVKLRRDAVRTSLVGVGVCIAALAWALWPDRVRPAIVDRPVATLKGPAKAAASEQLAINWSAFDAPIWNPSPAPASPQAPPPPLRLQLIAITKETAPSGTAFYVASLYDPDTDTLSVVRAGEKVAARKVVRVDALWVEIADTMGTRRLTLDVPASATPPPTAGAVNASSTPTSAKTTGAGGGELR